jgi:hypothetical protein
VGWEGGEKKKTCKVGMLSFSQCCGEKKKKGRGGKGRGGEV